MNSPTLHRGLQNPGLPGFLVTGWLGIRTALAVFLIRNTVFFIVFENAAGGLRYILAGP